MDSLSTVATLSLEHARSDMNERRLRILLWCGRAWGCLMLAIAIFNLVTGAPVVSIIAWFECVVLMAVTTALGKLMLRYVVDESRSERDFHEQMDALKRQIDFGMVERGFWPVTEQEEGQ